MEEQKALDAHYAFEFNGVRMDPYRIMSVYKNIKHPAHQHAVKKLLRAGESVKSLEQDIQEVVMTLNRWLEMIAEEREVAARAGVAEAPPNLNSMEAIRKHFGFPDPSEFHSILIGSCADNGGYPLYCTDLNKAPILTAHDPEETLASGATNRLKPVEDKAEVHVVNVNYGDGSCGRENVSRVIQEMLDKNLTTKAKWLDEAY